MALPVRVALIIWSLCLNRRPFFWPSSVFSQRSALRGVTDDFGRPDPNLDERPAAPEQRDQHQPHPPEQLPVRVAVIWRRSRFIKSCQPHEEVDGESGLKQCP